MNEWYFCTTHKQAYFAMDNCEKHSFQCTSNGPFKSRKHAIEWATMNTRKIITPETIEFASDFVDDFSQEMLAVANSRREEIEEYTSLAHPDMRGKPSGFRFNANAFEVCIAWDYYEGVGELAFPQSLLFNDEMLLAIKEKCELKETEAEKKTRQLAIARRDALLKKYPVETYPVGGNESPA